MGYDLWQSNADPLSVQKSQRSCFGNIAANVNIKTYSAGLAQWTVVFLWANEATLGMSQIVQQ